MTKIQRPRLNRTAIALAVLLGLAAAPAGAQAVDPARDSQSPGGPFSWLFRSTGLTAKPVEPKDFVKASRATAPSGDYLPVGIKAPDRSIKPLTPAEVKAQEQSLTAIAEERAKIAGPAAVKPAKPPKPAKTKPPAPQ